jgi:hypothetical protein
MRSILQEAGAGRRERARVREGEEVERTTKRRWRIDALIYAAGALGPCKQGNSDAALRRCAIGRDTIPGGCDSVFCLTVIIPRIHNHPKELRPSLESVLACKPAKLILVTTQNNHEALSQVATSLQKPNSKARNEAP